MPMLEKSETYRFIKRTSDKYNIMGYLTEAENISQILSEQII